jgi:NTE family protein
MHSNLASPVKAIKPTPKSAGKVTLVIGSGSVKCAAAVGVVKVLAENGIGIERVIGCSGGSIFATLIALQVSPENAKAATTRLWTRELTAKRNRLAILQSIAPKLFGFDLRTFSLRDHRPMKKLLSNFFGDRQIEDTPIPLHITATDFETGELVELSKGSISEAIRASSAIPFALPPVEIDGRMLIDGYVADPLPISVAIKHGAEVIVAVGFESPYQSKIDSVGRFAFQFSSIMANNLLKARFSFQSAVHHGEVIAMIPKFNQHISLFDTEKLPYIIAEGEATARQQLPYLLDLLNANAYTASQHC